MATNSKRIWLWLVVLVAADLYVPWHVVGQNASFSGAFLFWVGWTAVAVVSMFLIFRRWSN